MPKKNDWPLRMMFTWYKEGKTVHEIAELLSAPDMQKYWRKTLGHDYTPDFGTVHKVLSRHGCKLREQGARGARNGNWNGGTTRDKQGYILEAAPGHPYADSRGYVRQHRLVFEKFLGRHLLPGEVVHHKDENKDNNSLDNLSYYASNAEHIAAEHSGYKLTAEQIEARKMKTERNRRIECLSKFFPREILESSADQELDLLWLKYSTAIEDNKK